MTSTQSRSNRHSVKYRESVSSGGSASPVRMNAGVVVIFTCGTGVAVRARAVATPDASPMNPSSATMSHQKYRLPPLPANCILPIR